MVDTITGKEKRYNQMGTSAMSLISGRAEETVATPGTYEARWLRVLPYQDTRHFDEWDSTFLGEVQDPESDTVISQASAFGRQCDTVLIDAIGGTNYTGETGVTPVTFNTNYAVGSASSNEGLTSQKLIDAKEILMENEALEPGNPDDALVCILSAAQVADLMADSEFRSADFNVQKAMVEGEPVKWLGFNFVRTELLPVSATDVRTLYAYCKRYAVLGLGARSVKISIRDDRSEAKQIRTKGLIGATRKEEEGFCQIFCDETPD